MFDRRGLGCNSEGDWGIIEGHCGTIQKGIGVQFRRGLGYNSGTLQMRKRVVVGGVDLQYVGVAATRNVQCVLVLLDAHDGWIAAAAAAHGIKGGTVLESQDAEVGCTCNRCCSRDPASYLKLENI